MNKLKELTIKLPREWVEHLEQLEKTTDKSIGYYILESLNRQLEDLEDYEFGCKDLEKSNGVTYTSEQVTQKLKARWASKRSSTTL